MNLSVNWLRELVPGLDEPARAIAERLSRIATAVESVEPVGIELAGIVVGRVLAVREHPNADRLRLCDVDAGDGRQVRVVCGAPVISEGGLYPYVPAGATLPGGLEIEAREIRGVESRGMLCSEAELALGRDRGGIMRLPDGLEPGTPLGEVLGLPDVRLSLDLNPNRVDLACHVGTARELVRTGPDELAVRDFGGPAWEVSWRDGESEAVAGGVRVRIEDPARCTRYLGAVIRGVGVDRSPAWLAGRLLASGGQPINNIVDATNYVLRELNQPLHAFDLNALAGPEIRVRAAARGERITTLDGDAHALDPGSTVIADAEVPVALAGVMGGLDTEVTSETRDVFLECAVFDPGAVRATARGLGLATDASYRFERGIDASGAEAALVRCVELITAIAGGTADRDAVRVGSPAPTPLRLPLRAARVKQVLGLDLSPSDVGGLLAPIGFGVEGGGEEGRLTVEVPGWRNDVTREIDLVEEVARRFGYDRFPREERAFRPSTVPDDPAFQRADRARRLLVGHGFAEARSLTFVPEEHRGNRAEVAVPNPLSAEESFLRAALVPVLLRRLEHNFSRGRRDARLFEIGTVFGYASDPEAPVDPHDAGLERFREERRLGVLLTGGRAPVHWTGGREDFDLWDLKGLAADIAERLYDAAIEPLGEDRGEEARVRGGAWLDDDAFGLIRDGRLLGVAGAVRPSAVDAPPWAGRVWGIEADLDAIGPPGKARYEPLSAFPAVRRDLAIAVPAAVRAGDVEQAIRDAASELLETVRLFDVYEGEGLETGRRSLAWAFRFRAHDRTLTDEAVEAEMEAISALLRDRFDARVRTS